MTYLGEGEEHDLVLTRKDVDKCTRDQSVRISGEEPGLEEVPGQSGLSACLRKAPQQRLMRAGSWQGRSLLRSEDSFLPLD